MYIAAGQGQTTPGDKILIVDVNKNLLSLQSFATSFKKTSSKSDFIQFFHDFFLPVYSPGAGTDNPLGMKF